MSCEMAAGHHGVDRLPAFRGSRLSPAFLLVGCLIAGEASADVIVLVDGSRSEIQGFELAEMSIRILTLNGKTVSVIRSAIDVPSTLAANGMAPGETRSPGWPSGPRPEEPTQEKSTPPVPARPASPSGPPPIVERQPLPPDEAGWSPHRFAFFVNGATGTSPLEFSESRRFELFAEEAAIDSRYRDSTGPGFELGGAFRLAGPFGLAASVELFRNDPGVDYSALLPHPFFFERFRTFAGSEGGLTHEETAVHLDAVLSKTWGRHVTFDIFGGPSFFFTRTEVVADVLYSEVYPYDAVLPQGVLVSVIEDRPVGYNVGASMTYRIAGPVGIDLGVRFSRARVQLSPLPDRTIEFDAGGLRAAVGLRLLFR